MTGTRIHRDSNCNSNCFLKSASTYHYTIILQGQYEDSRTSCIDCPAGKYNDKAAKSGQSSCKQCLDGYIAPELGMTTCTVCKPVSDNNLITRSILVSLCFSQCFFA